VTIPRLVQPFSVPESAHVSTWQENKAWADAYSREVERVVRAVAGDIVRVLIAPKDIDMTEGADFIAQIPSGDIACRIRRGARRGWRRDLTLRLRVPSGQPTEVQKLSDEGVRWYLYAWAGESVFLHWMFVDLSVVRKARLIESALANNQVVHLRDGSSFLWIPVAVAMEATVTGPTVSVL
jgi:hypothetical protein